MDESTWDAPFTDENMQQTEARKAAECALKFKETGNWIWEHIQIYAVAHLVRAKRFDLLDELIERGDIDKELLAKAERLYAELAAAHVFDSLFEKWTVLDE